MRRSKHGVTGVCTLKGASVVLAGVPLGIEMRMVMVFESREPWLAEHWASDYEPPHFAMTRKTLFDFGSNGARQNYGKPFCDASNMVISLAEQTFFWFTVVDTGI